MKNKRALILVLLCVAFWALIPVVAKLGQKSLDSHQFLFWSSLVSALLFLMILPFNKKEKGAWTLSFKKWLSATVLGLLGTYIYYLLLYLGYAHAPGMEVLVLQYSWPIFVVILSIIILGEKLSIKKIFSLFLGFVGVIIILTKGAVQNLSFQNIKMELLVVLAAFFFGLFSVLSKRIKIDAVLLVTIYFITATVAASLSMLLFSSFSWPTTEALFPILLNGLLVNGISYLLWIKALKMGEAATLAPFVFLTPLLSSIYLLILFAEPFHSSYLWGMLAVLAAGGLNSFSKGEIN